MTAMIRLLSKDSKNSYAQIEKSELGFDCVCSFQDELERMNCVHDSGWS